MAVLGWFWGSLGVGWERLGAFGIVWERGTDGAYRRQIVWKNAIFWSFLGRFLPTFSRGKNGLAHFFCGFCSLKIVKKLKSPLLKWSKPTF